MSVVSVLSHIGKEILSVFKGAVKVAEEVEPFFDVAAPGLATLYNATVAAAVSAEALGEAAAAGTGTGAQKLANVVAAVTPTAVSVLSSLGIKADKVTITNYVNGVVATLNALPAPVAPVVAAK